MQPALPIRIALLLLALTAAACAQEQLPRLDGGTAAPATGWQLAKPLPSSTAPAGKPPAGAIATVPQGLMQPATPADKPAEPATVRFANGLLTVHAANSALPQILADITAKTGMAVEGTAEDERVFGDFGPAPVSKVIAQLLDGGGSNYMLFGMAANHAPRALMLSPKTSLAPGAALAAAQPPAPVANTDDDDDDDAQPVAVAPIRPLIPQPQENQPASGFASPGVRTPQQILEDMQRRRQEAQQLQSQ